MCPSLCPRLPCGIEPKLPSKSGYILYLISYTSLASSPSSSYFLPMSLICFCARHHIRGCFWEINLKYKSSPSIVWHHEYFSLHSVNCFSLHSIKLRHPITPIQRSILSSKVTEHTSNTLPLDWPSDGWWYLQVPFCLLFSSSPMT